MQLSKDTGNSRAEAKKALVRHGNDFDAARRELAPDLCQAEEAAAAELAKAAADGGLIKHAEVVALLDAHFADLINSPG
eukprot:931569-Prymnesium_polylepis.2